MTLCQRIVVFLGLSLAAALPAYAQSTPDAPADPAPSTSAGRWNIDDVKTLCHSRFGADDRSHGYQACLDRDKGKIGHDKSLGEIQELDAAKAANNPQ